jgi:hypothetical protein
LTSPPLDSLLHMTLGVASVLEFVDTLREEASMEPSVVAITDATVAS